MSEESWRSYGVSTSPMARHSVCILVFMGVGEWERDRVREGGDIERKEMWTDCSVSFSEWFCLSQWCVFTLTSTLWRGPLATERLQLSQRTEKRRANTHTHFRVRVSAVMLDCCFSTFRPVVFMHFQAYWSFDFYSRGLLVLASWLLAYLGVWTALLWLPPPA